MGVEFEMKIVVNCVVVMDKRRLRCRVAINRDRVAAAKSPRSNRAIVTMSTDCGRDMSRPYNNTVYHRPDQ